MKDEIKEILEGIEVVIKHDGTLEFDAKELKILLDYITNLQEGNHNLLQEIEDMQNINNKLIEENERLKEDNYELQKYINEEEGFVKDENRELGLRIDKAIEYLEQPYRDNFDYSKAELLNILQGDDKE